MDTFNLETTSGTASATVFKKAVSLEMGDGIDKVNIVYDGSNGGSIDADPIVHSVQFEVN